MKKLQVGITGGMGCGQSLVAGLLHERYQAPLVSMDEAGRRAAEKWDVKKNLRQTFGDNFYSTDGRLDRQGLGLLIFTDESKRLLLNRIIHPAMLRLVRQELAEASRLAGYCRYVLLDGALIYELDVAKELDVVVVVSAPENARIARIMARNRFSESEIRRRMASQWPLDDKVERADYLIDNAGSIESLSIQVDALHEWLVRRAG